MTAARSTARTGVFLGVAACCCWGLLPIYFHLLKDVPALKVLCHRVVWSLAMLALVVVATGSGRAIRQALTLRTIALLSASSLLICANWLVYIWSVQSGHVVAGSLGYFITPLINVVLGMAVLGERVRSGQGIAIALAAIGVAVLAILKGSDLWISLALALTFSAYGLIRKVVAIEALGGLTFETLLLAPVCIIILLRMHMVGDGAFEHSTMINLMLAMAGVVTAVPLLMFAAAARRLRYATLGLLQFIGPTLQFLQGVVLFHEPVHGNEFAAFGLIWLGCGVYAWEAMRSSSASLSATPRPQGEP